MTDATLYQSNDDGEIECTNGVITTGDGLATAFYLSIDGGNDEDSGVEADKAVQYWGNVIEQDEARKFRSKFQYLSQTLPLTTSNLQVLKEAAESDVAWTVPAGIADSYTVSLSIPRMNTLRVAFDVTVRTDVFPFAFDIPWGPSS